VKIVVLGAGGLLGQHVLDEGRKVGFAMTGLARADCDAASITELSQKVRGFDLIVNCAAYTNVDGAEKDEAAAYRANALAAENVAITAELDHAKAIHISTDFVFDGAKLGGYDEFDAPNPQSIYARSKLAGEQLFARRATRGFVLRVQGLYGAGGKNFSSRLYDLIKSGTALTLDAQRLVQPTWARAAARQLLVLAETEFYGTYHVSCSGAATWAEFAQRLAEQIGAAKNWREVSTVELAAAAHRPANCRFEHRMLTLRNLNWMSTWQAAQDAYLAEVVKEKA
jgi:dTDP-4-dehydrorhamnose reductase